MASAVIAFGVLVLIVLACLAPYLQRIELQDMSKRGRADAEAFVASNPSEQDIESAWSAACDDEAFTGDGYATAYKEVIRPLWQKLCQPAAP